MNGQPHARLNSFHGPKRQLLGNQAGHVAPAWRNVHELPGQIALAKGKQAMQETGSKIFLSKLPMDVGEKEVEELFRKTVGPLKECFLIHNASGNSKGMAVVSFQRPGDAAIARTKYNGKIVDGKRPLKIEIIIDNEITNPIKPQTPSLLARLGEKAKTPVANDSIPTQPRQPTRVIQPRPAPVASAAAVPAVSRRVRYKKGPKRLKKQLYVPLARVTREQLDKEMEDYRAAADTSEVW